MLQNDRAVKSQIYSRESRNPRMDTEQTADESKNINYTSEVLSSNIYASGFLKVRLAERSTSGENSLANEFPRKGSSLEGILDNSR